MKPDDSGLEVSGAVVRYDASRRGGDPTTAVDGVSLRVEPGKTLAVLGPSGCGKSTLLRAIAGLEPLAVGTVSWGGEDLADVPVHRRNFGLMFQDGQLFEHRDVAGNISYGLAGRTPWDVRRNAPRTGRKHPVDGANEPREGGENAPRMGQKRPAKGVKTPREWRGERVAEMLGMVGLAGFEKRSVSSLSGGQRQRVALARSLAPAPRLLLLDEPLSSLDRVLREDLTAVIARVLREAGTTALYVTHDHAEAFAVADEVGVMMAGTLRQVATPAHLLAHPADDDVAAFLGVAR